MSNRLAAAALAALVIASGCTGLGVGAPECEETVRDPTPAIVLTAQAVPTARYGPCLDDFKLAWDDWQFHAESGKVEISVFRNIDLLLTVTLTESCTVGRAERVPTSRTDIAKYEDVTSVAPAIRVTLIPTADRPLIHARGLARQYANTELRDRLVVFTVDDLIDQAVRPRVNRALLSSQFVWIIGELDIEEDTLELRRTPEGEGARGISVDEAFDRMEDVVPEVEYRGTWYHVFDGGCITYRFNASGRLAETIAEDAQTALGFYPLEELRELGRRQGLIIEAEDR